MDIASHFDKHCTEIISRLVRGFPLPPKGLITNKIRGRMFHVDQLIFGLNYFKLVGVLLNLASILAMYSNIILKRI